MNRVPQVLRDHPSLLQAIYSDMLGCSSILAEVYKNFIITKHADKTCKIWAKLTSEQNTLDLPNRHRVYWRYVKDMKKAKDYIEKMLTRDTSENRLFNNGRYYEGDPNLYPIGGITS